MLLKDQSRPSRKWGCVNLKDIAVFSVFLYIVLSIVFESTQVSYTFLSSIGLFFCLGCCLLYCLLRGKIRLNWLFWGLLFFGAVLTVSYFYTPAKVEAGSRVYRYWTSFVLVILACNVLTEQDDVQRVLTAFIVGGVGVSVYVYSYYGLDFLINSGTRLQNGDFGNVNGLGLHCVNAIAVAFYKLLTLKKEGGYRRKRVLLIAAMAICLPVMFFTGSRKAIFSLLVALCVFVFLYNNNKALTKRIFWILLIVGGLFLLVNTVPAFAPLKDRLTQFFESISRDPEQAQAGEKVVGDNDRQYFIQKGLEVFLESPVWGKGFCYSYYLYDTYSHNNYVELLMNNGIIGFVAYYWIYVKIIKDSLRLKERRDVMALVGMLMAKLLFEELGVVDHYSRMTLLLLGIIAACITTAQKRQKALREEALPHAVTRIQQKQE